MTPTSRRNLLLGAVGLAATVPAPWRAARAQAPAGPHTLPALPYAANANERAIDAMTMEIHHGRHHAAHVDKLNAALREHTALARMHLDDLLLRLSQLPDTVRSAIRDNGGGHANHSMFWEIMGGEGGEPAGDLRAAIDRDLGGMEKLRAEFDAAGMRVFGSGWVFVAVTPAGGLSIVAKPNQDTPLMDGGRVLIGNDVWEHAYYLRYRNRRADYLAAWWNVLDWGKIAARYEAARNGTLRV